MISKIIIILAAYYAIADESNEIIKDDDPANCVCDLTLNSCDAFCCCDSDCAADVISTWDTSNLKTNKCVNSKFTSYQSTSCPSSAEKYLEKARDGTDNTADRMNNLLCVDYDNSAAYGTYYKLIEDGDISSDTITKRINKNVEYSELLIIQESDSTIEPEYFLPGDIVGSSVNDWEQFGNRFTLPTPDSYGNCNDMNTVQ